jgi:hypothetical protein
MNIEKMLDTVADMILGVVPWFLSMFGHDPRVKKVQELVVASCNFLPTAASVAAMLSASNPIVTGVVAIATAICQAVTAGRAQALVGTVPTWGSVNGIAIEGDFVEGK